MRTPSLRRRIIATGIAVIALSLIVIDVIAYATLPQPLGAPEIPRIGVPDHGDQAARLAGPSVPSDHVHTPRVSQRVDLAAGATDEAAALRRARTLLVAGSAVTLIVAVLLFRRATTVALRPLELVVAAADRTAAGPFGERLEPDDVETELGHLAITHDRMLDELEEALATARGADERTRRFIDDAVHQLRAPLAAIRSSVEALLREADPQVRDRLLSNLVREAIRSNQLLSSLLSNARLDEGRPYELVPADLDALCRDEVERIAGLAPHLETTYQPRAGVEATWLLDDTGTRDVLSNLLDNARRRARARIDVDLRLLRSPGAEPIIELRVHDDGAGVPVEATDLIFERGTVFDSKGGSGLGLAIARTSARRQGGDLFHRDDAFVLHLPARKTSPEAQPN